MDPLGIIASVISIIGAITTSYRTIKRVSNLPGAFDKVQDDLAMVLKLLNNAKIKLEGVPMDADERNSLSAIAGRCEKKICEMREIFDSLEKKCLENPDDQSWTKLRVRYREAMKGVKSRRIENLMADLLKDIELLVMNQIACLATTKDLDDIKVAIDGLLNVEPSLEDHEFEGIGTIHATQSISDNASGNQWNLQGRELDNGFSQQICFESGYREKVKPFGVKVTVSCCSTGVGKTTMMSIVIRYLEEKKTANQAIVYAYLDHNDCVGAESLIASLVRQLAEQSDVLSKSLLESYKRHKDHDTPLLRRECEELLVSEAKRFQRVYMVIDGLDERRDEAMFGLFSRKIESIASCLEGPVVYDLEARCSDIDTYIDRSLASDLPILSRRIRKYTGLSDLIKKILNEKAQGMFLLPKLHLQILEKSKCRNRKAYEQLLCDLPSPLDQTYELLWNRIQEQDNEDAELARDIMTWLCCSLETMSIESFSYALVWSFTGHQGQVIDDDLIDEEQLTDVCLGLIVINKDKGTIGFSHYTAEDYFKRTFPSAEGHQRIASACIQCLSTTAEVTWEEIVVPELNSTSDPLRFRALLATPVYTAQLLRPLIFTYASRNWGLHAKNAGELLMLPQILRFFDLPEKMSASGRVLALSHDQSFLYDSRTPLPDKVAGIHLAAFFGLLSVIEKIAQAEPGSVDAVDTRGWSSLRWACFGKQTEAVKLLLHRGANADLQDIVGDTTLIWALGNRRTVNIFNGVHVVNRRHHFGQMALVKGLDSVNPTLPGEPHPFNCTAETIKDLIQHSTCLDTRGHLGRTALSHAAENQQFDVVQQLLERAVDYDCEDDNGMTPLLWSLQAPRWSYKFINCIFSNLTAHIGDFIVVDLMRTESDDGGPSRKLAARDVAQENIALQMIGSHIDAVDFSGLSALNLAAERRHYNLVERLIGLKADVNMMSGGLTPLDRASRPFHRYDLDMSTCVFTDACVVSAGSHMQIHWSKERGLKRVELSRFCQSESRICDILRQAGGKTSATENTDMHCQKDPRHVTSVSLDCLQDVMKFTQSIDPQANLRHTQNGYISESPMTTTFGNRRYVVSQPIDLRTLNSPDILAEDLLSNVERTLDKINKLQVIFSVGTVDSSEVRSFLKTLGTFQIARDLRNDMARNLTNFLSVDGLVREISPPGAGKCSVCDSSGSVSGKVCDVALNSTCESLDCDESASVVRSRLTSLAQSETTKPEHYKPVIHIGTRGSGDQVIKSASHRDMWTSSHQIIGFEMEGAGAWDSFPTILIKGVCDYADSHKNKNWQGYASASAAACLKAVLRRWTPVDEPTAPIVDMKQHDQWIQSFFLQPYKSQKDRNERAAVGTCSWVMANPLFLRWQSNEFSDVFWVTAEPGSGKSVLARAIIDRGERDVEWLYCYAFFRRKGDANQNRATDALCNILHQLFSHHHWLIKYAEPFIRTHGSKLFESFDLLWDILSEITASVNLGSVICIVDGLDESGAQNNEDDQHKLIRKLKEHQVNSHSQSPSGTVFKFLVFTRPYVIIVRELRELGQDFARLHIASVEHMGAIREDISHYIDFEMTSVRQKLSLSDEVCSVVRAKLARNMNRTYLWVSLVFREIERSRGKTVKKILKMIDNLPNTVEGIYETILEDVEDRDETENLFMIIQAAKRPLTLSEIDVAMELAGESTRYEGLDLEGDEGRMEYIRQASCLLVLVDENKLYFIHETVSDFLSRAPGPVKVKPGSEAGSRPWKSTISRKDSHATLAKLCLAFLRLEDFTKAGLRLQLSYKYKDTGHPRTTCFPWTIESYHLGSMKSLVERLVNGEMLPDGTISVDLTESVSVHPNHPFGEHLKEIKARFSFLEYAATYWHIHVAEADMEPDGFILSLFDINSPQYATWLPIYWQTAPRHERAHLSASILALCFGNRRALSRLIANGLAVDERDPFGQTALHWAASRTSREDLEFLISQESVIDAADSFGRTPLMEAVIAQRQAHVAILLDHDADPNLRDHMGLRPIHMAKNTIEIAASLLDKGAEIKPTDKVGRCPMDFAAEGSHTNVLKLLIDRGAEPQPWTVFKAEEWQNEEIKRLLRDRMRELGAAARSEAERNASPTARMVNSIKLNDAKKLLVVLDRHAEVLAATDSTGNNALHIAATKCSVEVACLLVERGIDPNAVNKAGVNAQFFAQIGDNKPMIAYLREVGVQGFCKATSAEEDVISELRSHAQLLEIPPLVAAVRLRAADIVLQLLEEGENVNQTWGPLRETPIFAAVERDQQLIINVLLGFGADVDSRNLLQQNLLHCCILTTGSASLADFLVQCKVSINHFDYSGVYPLNYARKLGLEEVQQVIQHRRDDELRSVSSQELDVLGVSQIITAVTSLIQAERRGMDVSKFSDRLLHHRPRPGVLEELVFWDDPAPKPDEQMTDPVINNYSPGNVSQIPYRPSQGVSLEEHADPEQDEPVLVDKDTVPRWFEPQLQVAAVILYKLLSNKVESSKDQVTRDINRGSPTVGNLVPIFEAWKLLADEAPDTVDPHQRPEKLGVNDGEEHWPSLYRLLDFFCNRVTGHGDDDDASNDNGDKGDTEKTGADDSMEEWYLKQIVTELNSRRKDPMMLYLRYLEGRDSDDEEMYLTDEKIQEKILDEAAARRKQQPWNRYTYLFVHERLIGVDAHDPDTRSIALLARLRPGFRNGSNSHEDDPHLGAIRAPGTFQDEHKDIDKRKSEFYKWIKTDRKIEDEHVIHGTKVVPVGRRPGIANPKSTETGNTEVFKAPSLEGIQR
ncbi:ankyrin repeat-containing protein [Fusarium mexicanum]|uniref:Ankyrin repeat-containing protein n=1 Tax=Fusarium mexicanum TaxID=751941 RepID=A0A8H5N804_9HYPO|nr:ankyrin repeat-containing protein [Fusarium mexicanum]